MLTRKAQMEIHDWNTDELMRLRELLQHVSAYGELPTEKE
jgi:hypothetical protein